jgi:hypothetical protein
MNDEIKPFSETDYRNFLEALEYQRGQIKILRADVAGLNTENRGWLQIYRRHLSLIDVLQAEILYLRSLPESPQE